MIKQYFSKVDFLKDLSQFSKKIDVDASAKLPSFCLQDEDGKQYTATKPVIMYHLVNAIEDSEIINRNKSCTYKRKFMSVCWKEELEEEVTEVIVEPIIEPVVIVEPIIEPVVIVEPIIEAPAPEIKEEIKIEEKVVAPKPKPKSKKTPAKKNK